MKQRKIIVISIVTLLVVLVGMFAWHIAYTQKNIAITSYDECVAAGYPVMESYPEQCAVPGGKTFTRTTQETSISIEGRTVCLPRRSMDGPHTMECALGLKTDDGKYYGLGTDHDDTALSVNDRRVRVIGTLKREDSLKYDSEGTITVTAHEFLD